MPKQHKKPRLVDIAPVMRAVRDELDVLSLRVIDGRRDDGDEKVDTQKIVNEGFKKFVGEAEHEASPGDIRSLVANLATVLDLLRVLRVT